VAYNVPNRVTLEQIIEAEKIDRNHHAGNLRQLLRFNKVDDERTGCHDAKNWQLYEEGDGSAKTVQCIQRRGAETVYPLVGNLDHRWHLAKQHAPDMDRAKLARLLNGSLKKIVLSDIVWIRGRLPPSAYLNDRQSIVTLRAAALPPPQAPSWAARLGAQSSAASSGSSLSIPTGAGNGTIAPVGAEATLKQQVSLRFVLVRAWRQKALALSLVLSQCLSCADAI